MNCDFLNKYYKTMKVAEITAKIERLVEKQRKCNVKIAKLFTDTEKQKDQFWAIEREIIGLERMKVKTENT